MINLLLVILGLVVSGSASCVTNATCQAGYDCKYNITMGMNVSACVPSCGVVSCNVSTDICEVANQGIQCIMANGSMSNSPCGSCPFNTDCKYTQLFGYICMDSCSYLNCTNNQTCSQNTTTVTSTCEAAAFTGFQGDFCNASNPCSNCFCSGNATCACTSNICTCNSVANISLCQQLSCSELCQYNTTSANYSCVPKSTSACPSCSSPNVCDYNKTSGLFGCVPPYVVPPSVPCNGSCFVGEVCDQDVCTPWSQTNNDNACQGKCGPSFCLLSSNTYNCTGGTTCSPLCNGTDVCAFIGGVGWECSFDNCGGCSVGESCNLVNSAYVCENDTAMPTVGPASCAVGCLSNETCVLTNGSYKCEAVDPCSLCSLTEACFPRQSNKSISFCTSTCTDVACPVDQTCSVIPGVPPMCSGNCSSLSCGVNEKCVNNQNGTAVCEPTASTDPCGNCTSTQQCQQEGGSTKCESIDTCNLARRQEGQLVCLFPENCVIAADGYAICVPPTPTSCVESECVKQNKVCGPAGDCITDKCIAFSWPPPGVQYCSPDKSCPTGKKCTGCTASATCNSATGATTYGNDCRPTCEIFSLLCNVTEQDSWTPEELRDCCAVASIGCSIYDCLDEMPVEQWSSDKKTFCCNSTGKGCPPKAGEYDCLDSSDLTGWQFVKKQWCCNNKQIGCPVGYDCSSNPSSWNQEQSTYCCKLKGKGCTATNGYDCTWNNQTTSVWSNKQKDWCCSNAGVRCPPQDLFSCPDNTTQYSDDQSEWCCANRNRGCPYSCQERNTSRQSWTEEQRKYCCLYDGIGCKANIDNFDCFDSSQVWTSKQKKYCCKEEDIGCQISCNGLLLSESDKVHCCNEKGLYCNEKIQDPTLSENMIRKRFRLSFRADWGSVVQNPKRMIRMFRLTLYHASRTAVSESANIDIEFIGSKTPIGDFPTNDDLHNWGIIASTNWSMGIIPAEVNKSVTASRNFRVLSETRNEASVASDHLFVYYSLYGTDESVMNSVSHEIDVTGINAAGKNPTGPMHDNAEGYSLILRHPRNELIDRSAGETLPPPSSSSTDSVLLIIGILLGVLILGGFVGMYINRQKRPSGLTEYSGQLEEMTPAERKIFETPETVETGTI